MAAPHELLLSVINHVTLPPQIPAREDHDSSVNQELARRLIQAAQSIRDHANGERLLEWERLLSVLKNSQALISEGHLNKAMLLERLRALPPGRALIIHVASQNAGILVYRQTCGTAANEVFFEIFEASPSSADVLASENALEWDFPGSTVAVPYSRFADESFLESMATFIERASSESISQFASTAAKAESHTTEPRDTVNPALVSQFFLTVLEVVGRRADRPTFCKRIRDDVSWAHGSELPWRRSPFWLVLRVGVQIRLQNVHGLNLGRFQYKLLITVVVAQLLRDAIGAMEPGPIALVKAKLGRRLAKLEILRPSILDDRRSCYDHGQLFEAMGNFFEKIMRRSTQHIDSEWGSFKLRTRRSVPPLASRADSHDMVLSLPSSGPYVDSVMAWDGELHSMPQVFPSGDVPNGYNRYSSNINLAGRFTNRYFDLAQYEETLNDRYGQRPESTPIQRIATDVGEYLRLVSAAYDSDPEQKSSMILHLMRMWCQMDRMVTSIYALVLDYNPGFPPEMLDALHITNLGDMDMLRMVQEYLQWRHELCGASSATIFEDPSPDCFAVRYFDNSPQSSHLRELLSTLEAAAARGRLAKETEWNRVTAEAKGLEDDISTETCLLTTISDEDEHFRRCRRCFLKRQRRRMKIDIFEHPLPTDIPQKKAMVFELGTPSEFCLYRVTTWAVLHLLEQDGQREQFGPPTLLSASTFLTPYPKSPGRVSLASTTKPFKETHYRTLKLPTSLSQVCRPCGLTLKYFDATERRWIAPRSGALTITHHLRIPPPLRALLSTCNKVELKAKPATPQLTSYDVIANQLHCPSGLNIHEFISLNQAFSAGDEQRWLNLLIELGSSNLNFSTEAIRVMVDTLCSRAGPAHNNDVLRKAHRVFRDPGFCDRLGQLVRQKLDSILSNWREANCMDVLITLILRICAWASEPGDLSCSHELLQASRNATYHWVTTLPTEIHAATDAETVRRMAGYIFTAALLYRKTFSTLLWAADSDNPEPLIHSQELSRWIEVSILFRDNMPSEPDTLSVVLRNALIRDSKLVVHLQKILRESLIADMGSFTAAISRVSFHSVEEDHSITDIAFVPDSWWIQATAHATETMQQQTYSYNLVEGYFLVDGKPMGQLPTEDRESIVLRNLFGNQNLLTLPSRLRGMTHMVAYVHGDHQVHFGCRGGLLFVRAIYRRNLLEFVPQHCFVREHEYDLPAPLVDNCVHWLNVTTGELEVRVRPDIWRSKRSNWKVDMRSRTATRESRTLNTLIDPFSRLSRRITGIFAHFEEAKQLIILQSWPPGRSPHLRVELHRLELKFSVNKNGLLESRDLRSEVDPNQDAGTWYGLKSSLVLRNIVNHSRRTAIVPLGPLKYKRNRFHVAVYIENLGQYGRFTINELLGRIECPPEPFLIYSKAMFHAFTSFVAPDPLTGRTGTEESFHCLKSGSSSPWLPLNQLTTDVLSTLATLIPLRGYYPKDMKVMERVTWDPDLPSTTQHDGFLPILHAILDKSRMLGIFSPPSVEIPTISFTEPQLARRAFQRRIHSERPWESRNAHPAADMAYQSRHNCPSTKARRNAFEVSTLIVSPPATIQISTLTPISTIMASWTDVGGFTQPFSKPFLSDILSTCMDREWGSLVQLCHQYDANRDMFALIFVLALLAFRDDIPMDLVRVLVGFAIYPEFKELDMPQGSLFVQFQYHRAPSVDELIALMRPHSVPYAPQGQEDLGPLASARMRRQITTARTTHERDVRTESEGIARRLLQQWPCEEPSILDIPPPGLVDLPEAFNSILPEWHRLYQNWELSTWIDLVQQQLRPRRSNRAISVPEILLPGRTLSHTQVAMSWRPCLSELLSRASVDGHGQPSDPSGVVEDPGAAQSDGPDIQIRAPGIPPPRTPSDLISSEVRELREVVRALAQSKSTIRKNYAVALLSSIESFRQKSTQIEGRTNLARDKADVSQSLRASRDRMQDHFRHLTQSLEDSDLRCRWLKLGGIWPAVTPIALLEELRSVSPTSYDVTVKELLTAYGVSITETQRLVRMEDSSLQRDPLKLEQDRGNHGHANWNPLHRPDWLLLEIEANILLRPNQSDVATATIWPPSQENSVLQMNMGEGKTSCIMILCAATLANFDQLTRVIVPKALLQQTAQLLQSRLGGLLGRSVTHIPWSRKTSTHVATTEAYRHLHVAAKDNAGILVSLPEHLLSFILSGQQRLSDGQILEARAMIHHQNWLQTTCRDVLDECDHTLAVRTQLIYPSGSQTAVDGHPHRWETCEELLKLTQSHLWSLRNEFPQSLDISRTGGFPVMHFLRKDVEDALLERLARDVLQDRIPLLPTLRLASDDREVIRRYISEALVSASTSARVQDIFGSHQVAMQNLHLVRGLIAHRILLLTLKKRWNVQYGLHPHRDPLAVPYHAKGVPSDQAEWGHPDVAILFTCLSFYYGGLRLHELKQSLEHVVKSDDPPGEYERWHHRSATLPDSLRDWSAINIEDAPQLKQLWIHVRHEGAIIDFFLNHFVFPKFAKQFTTKLQSSGWDLPLPSPTAAVVRGALDPRQKALTTGFSGTNDNRTLLPLTIRQQDLHALSHTNAEVLTYLLQTRNRRTIVAADPRGSRLSERDMLHLLCDEHIRILMDAGAMILEMDNATVATEWLKVDWRAPAAVYFDENNKPMVMSRNSSCLPLVATPYAENLGDALIYLDQSHTRGTDLGIPPDATGALTLGLGQTKDATVQAAMRLRQLATTQSIVFIAPPEVHQSILDLQRMPFGSGIDSRDVIGWLLEQTCIGLEQLQPLYYSQGLAFCQRRQSVLKHPEFLSSSEQRALYLAKLRQNELQTLEKMYRPKKGGRLAIRAEEHAASIRGFVTQLEALRQGFEDSGYAAHASALEEVEQEREVAFEVESVREVQKPVRFQPLQFPGLHLDLVQFLETGKVSPHSDGYEHAFLSMSKSALGQRRKVGRKETAMLLYASKELSRTVKLRPQRPNDNFIRPVNWILFSVRTDTAIMINPEEAEAAIPIIRNLPKPETHLLLYAAPVIKRMMHFNDLRYYALPPMSANWCAPNWLRIGLGLFAGRLYFDFDEYEDILRFLGLRSTGEAAGHADGPGPQINSLVPSPGLFTASPLLFIQDWLSIRRKGQDFAHTPMGFICRGKPLTAAHPFFVQPEAQADVRPPQNNGRKPGSPFASEGYETGDEFAETVDNQDG